MTQVRELNIAIVPSREVSERAIELSQRLLGAQGLFTLGEVTAIPHVSLYHFGVKPDLVGEVETRLQTLARGIKPFELKQKQLRNYAGGWIDIEYKKDGEVLNLQKKVVGTLNFLRKGYIRPDELIDYQDQPPNRRDNINNYGFGSVGECYHPHLTLTKTPSYNARALALLPPSVMTFTVAQIAMFELGEWGTCKRLLRTYKLG